MLAREGASTGRFEGIAGRTGRRCRMRCGHHVRSATALVGVTWRKSSHSGPNGGQCVEVAPGLGVVGVRDSKNPAGPALLFDSAVWSAFVRSL
ncbi:DUF397 domain-containing protein [Saccharopolyspora sp. NFXS83]|uniref:DUF397 domain-containing protein n=1 Tax=Saccharopolyspora sp. NFXS83 TaxID=2993560 RepID=UPI002B05AF96|nr:DUF397 domain-containing protein [Saccharopolyspora sp. NFXS83]